MNVRKLVLDNNEDRIQEYKLPNVRDSVAK